MVKVYGQKTEVKPLFNIGDIVGKLGGLHSEPTVTFYYITGVRVCSDFKLGPSVEYLVGTDPSKWHQEIDLMSPKQIVEQAHAHQRIWADCWDKIRQLGDEVERGDVSNW